MISIGNQDLKHPNKGNSNISNTTNHHDSGNENKGNGKEPRKTEPEICKSTSCSSLVHLNAIVSPHKSKTTSQSQSQQYPQSQNHVNENTPSKTTILHSLNPNSTLLYFINSIKYLTCPKCGFFSYFGNGIMSTSSSSLLNSDPNTLNLKHNLGFTSNPNSQKNMKHIGFTWPFSRDELVCIRSIIYLFYFILLLH
jgi:hypothetical protein